MAGNIFIMASYPTIIAQLLQTWQGFSGVYIKVGLPLGGGGVAFFVCVNVYGKRPQ